MSEGKTSLMPIMIGIIVVSVLAFGALLGYRHYKLRVQTTEIYMMHDRNQMEMMKLEVEVKHLNALLREHGDENRPQQLEALDRVRAEIKQHEETLRKHKQLSDSYEQRLRDLDERPLFSW